MVKRYCDCCGKEISEEQSRTDPSDLELTFVPAEGKRLTVVVVVTDDSNGDFCRSCILDLVKKLEVQHES